jgi:tRNA pseudouridine-54 N-methylase
MSPRSVVKPLAEVLAKVMSMSLRLVMKPHVEVLVKVMLMSLRSPCRSVG